MPTLVGDVTGLLNALRLEQAAVVAHDWGAGLAWNLAMARPDRVSRLAVISVGHGGTAATAGLRQREMSWYMLWFLFPGVAEQVLPREDWAFYTPLGLGGHVGGNGHRRRSPDRRPVPSRCVDRRAELVPGQHPSRTVRADRETAPAATRDVSDDGRLVQR